MDNVLTVTQLQKNYGAIEAVKPLSFSIAPGKIVGLLGQNGAGKTTTINMILGVLEPSAGEIFIHGHNLLKNRTLALSHTNFAAVYAPLPGNLTIYQNLRLFGMLYGVSHLTTRITEVMEQFDLRKFRNTKCGVLSSGEQTRVCLAKAMLNNPSLLLLDEPTASLDPATARDIRNHIRNFTQNGTSGVLWTSHNMQEVEEVCDHVLIMQKGNILLQGNPLTLPKEHGKENLEALFLSIADETFTSLPV